MQTKFIDISTTTTSSTSLSREKRPLDPSSTDERESKRPALANVIVEALKVDSLQKLCASLEPILRRVVSEEVERALAKLGASKFGERASPKRIQAHDGRNLQLQIRSRLSLPLFTGGKVEGEHGTAIHVVLLDGNNQQIVTSGSESCVKLDVVVLEGDFNNEDDEGWGQEEFDSHIVKEREGKRPLLSGDLQVILKDGIGSLGELAFTDNSSWIRSRKFRLGLKVASGFCEGIRIREAKTDAFTVKDHRGELYKKHYPPALHDEVWRLEKIGKDGSFHKRLNKSGIQTVEDFLRFVVRDAQRLRNILGSGMSNKMWDVLVEHAKTCVLTGKLYIYYSDDAQNIGVVFNNIHEFIGLIAGEEGYHSADTLSESQKVYVDALVKKAYENWMHVIEYDGKSVLKDNNNNNNLASQEYSNSYDSQTAFPTSLPSQQSSTNTGLPPIVGGCHNGLDSRYNPTQSSIPYILPHESQIPRPEDLSTQSLTSGFHTGAGGALSEFGSFRNIGAGELFSEEEIRMRSHEMLENDDMQQLLGFLNMEGGHSRSSTTSSTLDSISYPSTSASIYAAPNNAGYNNYGLVGGGVGVGGADEGGPPGKAVVGWLKLKAAMRWGIFIRKKAAERRAQLVELDDNY
ncbi:calmodulin-binding protein 60 D-like [Impatiens glandulifera]|uniref:calmodulin-binding protein 60 D-like n=1 Tax=Impatiens glandulifera TaxID=253017 RepID=UPI001FB106DC|nr:calmodulin-binding protein 60 D-like [Impatiens glandulifera]